MIVIFIQRSTSMGREYQVTNGGMRITYDRTQQSTSTHLPSGNIPSRITLPIQYSGENTECLTENIIEDSIEEEEGVPISGGGLRTSIITQLSRTQTRLEGHMDSS